MRTHTRLVSALTTVVALTLTGCSEGSEMTAENYSNAWAASKSVVLPTEEGLVTTMGEAYSFARDVAEGLPGAGERFGYKFGCGAAVCPFAEHVPLVGTLWEPMIRPSGTVLDQEEWVRGFVEGELAFRFNSDVTSPQTADQIRGLVSDVAPSAELPDFPFGDMPLNETPILDVIADNGIARGLVLGNFIPVTEVAVDSITMTGTRDGAPVLAGSASDVTGGSHWDALALAVELLLANGRDIRSGDVIITGTLGDPSPMTPGTYVLDFGELGRVDFTVADS